MKTRLVTKWLSVVKPLAIALALCSAAPASAVMIVFDDITPVSITGVAGFATTGAQMSGLEVRAFFANSTFDELLSWGTTGSDSGGVFANNWSLSVVGNTFGAEWQFVNDTGSNLLKLVLNGAPGLTLFDTYFDGSVGTTGSALGSNFDDFTDANPPPTATYSNPIALGSDSLVGDLYHVLTVSDFGVGGSGRAGGWGFFQDTDNDSRKPPNGVPEPSMVALMSLGLLGLGFARRFSRNS